MSDEKLDLKTTVNLPNTEFPQKGNLQKDDIGKIEVLDFMSFVAVKKEGSEQLLRAVQSEKMKGKKYKIVVTT